MSSPQELSPEEAALIEECYRQQFDHLYKTAAIILGNPHLAYDIVQDTFVHASKNIDDFMKSPSPGGWLYNAMKYQIQHALRTRNMLLARNVPLETAYNLAAGEEQFEINELDIANNTDLQLLTRYFLHGYSLQEIANEYAVTLGAIKMRIKRAKDRLQNDPNIKELKDFYF